MHVLAFALERHPSILYGAAAFASAAVGLMLARGEEGVPLPLIALAGLAVMLLMVSVPPTTLFIGWFFAAPLLAEATADSAIGSALALALYALPAFLIAILTVTHLRRNLSLSFVDFLPLAYVAYVLVSLAAGAELTEPTVERTLLVVFLNVALGPCLYYFLVVGPGRAVEAPKLLLLLMVGASIQGVMALVEAATHRNLWGYYHWDKDAGWRAVSTLANPGVLGAYLGVGIVIAVAILTWRGPRSLRRWAFATLVVCLPGLLVTLTRAPAAATALAVVALLVLGRKRVVAFAVIATALVALAFAWPHIQDSSIYQSRVSDVQTVRERKGLQQVSLELARQKPVLGWGFGSLDRAKATADLPHIEGVASMVAIRDGGTHNTYLTVLVELGALGLLVLLIPFVVIVTRALARIASLTEDRWVVAAASGSLVVLLLTGTTLDYRFFSFVPALAFVMLALLRRMTGESGGSAVGAA